MITLPVGPFQVTDYVALAIAILVQHVGQVIGVGDESLGNEAMNLERLALQTYTPIALTIIGSYLVQCSRTAVRIGRAIHISVP